MNTSCIKVIKIDRSKWRTGGNSEHATGKGYTELINNDGYKCCLGFITQQQCKVNKNKLLNKIDPTELNFVVKNLSEADEHSIIITELTDRAMCINDCDYTTPQEKEKQLKELFKDKYELEFYGDYTHFTII